MSKEEESNDVFEVLCSGEDDGATRLHPTARHGPMDFVVTGCFGRENTEQQPHPAPSETATDWWIILNPASGDTDHVDRVRQLADERGYTLDETQGEGDAVMFAKNAVASGADLLAACGGDGTIHEVLCGLNEANAFDTVTLGVIPAGTANIFATNIGIESIEDGFDALEQGETRRIDLGMAGDEPFVMACVIGLIADVSEAASSELKARFGTTAFLITGLLEGGDFDPLQLSVSAVVDGNEREWTGEALCVLIGNSRRFTQQGGQANMEDGLLEIAIIEQLPPTAMIIEAAAHRLLGRDTEHVTRFDAERLNITTQDSSEIDFNLDGEPNSDEKLTVTARPRTLDVRVGPSYDPSAATDR